MTSKSKHDSFLLTLLPAAVILAIYAFLIALPKQRSYQAQLTALTAAKQTAIDESQADQSKDNLALARQALNRLRDRCANERIQIKQLSQDWRNTDSILDTLQEITEILGDHQLSIVSQNFEQEPQISSYFRELASAIDSESPAAPNLEFWQIELEGSYSNVERFLDAIDIQRMNTLPLTLSMVASESQNGVHKWTIIFVL